MYRNYDKQWDKSDWRAAEAIDVSSAVQFKCKPSSEESFLPAFLYRNALLTAISARLLFHEQCLEYSLEPVALQKRSVCQDDTG